MIKRTSLNRDNFQTTNLHRQTTIDKFFPKHLLLMWLLQGLLVFLRILTKKITQDSHHLIRTSTTSIPNKKKQKLQIMGCFSQFSPCFLVSHMVFFHQGKSRIPELDVPNSHRCPQNQSLGKTGAGGEFMEWYPQLKLPKGKNPMESTVVFLDLKKKSGVDFLYVKFETIFAEDCRNKAQMKRNEIWILKKKKLVSFGI